MYNGKNHKQGIPEGTIEMFGESLDLQTQITGIIETVYREFGFDLLRTPILEYAEVFKGHHGEGEKFLFNIHDHKNEDLVLRYDLTVPLARYISNHSDIPIPFKRYQIAAVFRDNKKSNGHLREFTQCDADIVGTSDLTADSEIISMAYMGLLRLGFSDFVINVNHRRIINAIYEKSELLYSPEGRKNLQKTLDEIHRFLEKWEHHNDPDYQDSFDASVDKILKKHKLSPKTLEIVRSILSFKGSFDQKLSAMKNFLEGFPEAVSGIEELKEITSYLDSEAKEKINFDVSLVREFDYYTGFILEGNIPNIPIGAVLGGGRFDNLVRSFGGRDIPAVGMAFDLESIAASLMADGVATELCSAIRAIVVPRSREEKTKLLDEARKLRRMGMSVDYIPMISYTEDEILVYARKRGFSFLITNDPKGLQIRNIKDGSNLSNILLVTN